MNNSQKTITAILIFTFVTAMVAIANSAAQFVAMTIFLSIPVIAGLVILLTAKFLINRSKRKVASQAQKNVRITNNERAMEARKANVVKAEELMDIPAYARKAQNIHFPMTKPVLDGLVVVNGR